MGHEDVDHAVDGRDVGGAHAKVRPVVPADQVRGIVLELADDRPQGLGVRRRVEVADDVDVDAELVDDLHRLAGLRAPGVVVDRHLGHDSPR